jgi:hypothetical protein
MRSDRNAPNLNWLFFGVKNQGVCQVIRDVIISIDIFMDIPWPWGLRHLEIFGEI